MEREPVFREVQRFRQPWVWALLGGIALLMFVLGPVLWGGLLVVGAVAGFVYSLRLQTEVRADGIYLKLWPLHRSFRRISWSEIERYESIRYRPLRDFGGWGNPLGPRQDRVQTSVGIEESGSNGRTGVAFSSAHNVPRNWSVPSTSLYRSLGMGVSLLTVSQYFGHSQWADIPETTLRTYTPAPMSAIPRSPARSTGSSNATTPMAAMPTMPTADHVP